VSAGFEGERGRVIRREWRAPRTNGAAVIEPVWPDLPARLQDNQQLFETTANGLTNLSWNDWRTWCRSDAIATAIDYTRHTLHLPTSPVTSGPLIVGGHQPEFFHPGVWAKNFAVGRLAQHVHGTALHLIVDSDVSSSVTVLVPAGTRSSPVLEPVPFDRSRPQQPWELATLQDRDLWSSFGQRAQHALQRWSLDPVLQQLWPEVIERTHGQTSLVPLMTLPRGLIEQQWGLCNLELPLSRLAVTPAALRFLAEIVSRLPEFVAHHNAVLREYRVLNRVRSRAHPVPDLGIEGEWFEAPFWVWRAGEHRRDRLWSRCVAGRITLRDRHGPFVEMPLVDGRGLAAITPLVELAARGIHLRTRALTTTLLARLGLADLFIHGLGGAKYDEMTDALMTRFFGIAPPAFVTVTATAHLPLGGPFPVTSQDLGDIRHALRDLDQNPQRHVTSTASSTRALIDERQTRLDALSSSVDANKLECKAHYRRIREINRSLAALLTDERTTLDNQLATTTAALTANPILTRREFPWLLYPATQLQSLYEALFPQE
jgi:hypothetical protein